MKPDQATINLFFIIVAVLVIASLISFVLRRTKGPSALLKNLRERTVTWWFMSAIFALFTLLGNGGLTLLFGLISFMALREFITLTPTKRGDHRALFWIFFVIAPLQYFWVWTGNYGMFSILIPVYAFLFVPSRMVLSGDTENFLERAAKIQWGLMICVYCLSHAPALLTLHLRGYGPSNIALLLFFVIVSQINDVLQYAWGKMLGKTKIAPLVSPNKTWEGFIGGTICATLLGTALWWATPFLWWQAALMSLLITLLGFLGGLTMSAIKRDRGIKDYGTLLQGHGGFLDRIDSLCFAAPLFFHATRYFFQQ